jgi:hypothetical protein
MGASTQWATAPVRLVRPGSKTVAASACQAQRSLSSARRAARPRGRWSADADAGAPVPGLLKFGSTLCRSRSRRKGASSGPCPGPRRDEVRVAGEWSSSVRLRPVSMFAVEVRDVDLGLDADEVALVVVEARQAQGVRLLVVKGEVAHCSGGGIELERPAVRFRCAGVDAEAEAAGRPRRPCRAASRERPPSSAWLSPPRPRLSCPQGRRRRACQRRTASG